jgi:catechol 2,3-dioxygenase-like lactoylglutathione lyase family enzyme
MSLSKFKVGAAIAVTDVARAKEFYEDKLGLENGREVEDGGVTYPCGGGTEIHVFPSPDNAGKSEATLAGWEVDDVEKTVDELTEKGVTFEQYDAGPIKTNEKGIAQPGGDVKTAWCKDPDGNVLGIIGS